MNEQSLNLLTTNAADLRLKIKCLKDLVNMFKTSIFSVQETHFKKKGKFSIDNFTIFEALRKKEGGGSMLGVHVALKPVLIIEYSDTFELIVVEVKVGGKNIRVLTGYGPQDSWELDVKMQFFRSFEEEIAKAALENKSIIFMGDMNSKLGPEFIPNYPKQITENGKILAGILNGNQIPKLASMKYIT